MFFETAMPRTAGRIKDAWFQPLCQLALICAPLLEVSLAFMSRIRLGEITEVTPKKRLI
jgi:hypothetical protein